MQPLAVPDPPNNEDLLSAFLEECERRGLKIFENEHGRVIMEAELNGAKFHRKLVHLPDHDGTTFVDIAATGYIEALGLGSLLQPQYNQATLPFSKSGISGIITSEMAEVEPNRQLEQQPPIMVEGSAVELPWQPGSTANEIGYAALTAVQSRQQRRVELQAEIEQLRQEEQAIVLAAKDAGHFSWSGLARVFQLTKSRMVATYDPKTRAAQKQSSLRHQRELRATAAKVRESA